MNMDDLRNKLRPFLPSHTIEAIIDAFSYSQALPRSEQRLALLTEELRERRQFWSVSPSGDSLMLIAGAQLILLNERGCWLLQNEALFAEGELAVRNLRWIENESLVIYDLFYPVHRMTQHVICHYGSEDDWMLWTGQIKSDEETQAERKPTDADGNDLPESLLSGWEDDCPNEW